MKKNNLSNAEYLVSVIMPCYNSSKYIELSIESVIRQTYTNWELIIVDDCSTDDSVEIIKNYKDIRIKLIVLTCNNGNPAIPRNIGIENSKGRFIAFLDSDDLWLPTKLERQISFMICKKIAITSTSYYLMDELGCKLNRVIKAPIKLTRNMYMKNTSIGFSSSMIDSEKIKALYFSPLPIAEDYLFWVETLNNGYDLIGLQEILMCYRVQVKSLSSNKFSSAYQVFKINYQILNLGVLRSIYYFLNYSINAVLKRVLIFNWHE